MPQISKFVQFMQSQKALTPSKIVKFVYHLPSLVRLSWRLLWDRRVPKLLKLYCVLAVVYLLVPVDFISDGLVLLFGVGVADDFTLLFLAFYKLIKDSPREVVDEHVRAISGRGQIASPNGETD